MVLLVARSLAVYGGAAAILLGLAHRFVLPLPRRTALLLAAAPLLFTGRAVFSGAVYGPIDILYNGNPFGSMRQELSVADDRTPLLGDIVYQQIPWRAAVREAIAEGRLPLWNPHVLAGEPLLGVAQAAVLHPGTLFGLLLPLPQAWTFDVTLRLLIALLAAFLLLRDLGCCTRASLLGGLGWAFSNWMVFYLGVPPMAAAAPIPLLLLGVRRLTREPGARSAAIAVAAVLLIAAAGHPETLLHAGAGAGLYFLFELFGARRGRRLRPVLAAAGAAVFAFGLSAVILWPVAELLPHTHEHFLRKHWYAKQPRSLPASESLGRLTPQVVPYAVGVSGHGRLAEGFIEPSAYAGALLFPLAFSGLFARGRARCFFVGIGLLGLAVWTKTAVADALAKLPLFDIALNERMLLWTLLALCVLAALGANRFRDGEGAPAFVAGAVATLALTAWLFVRAEPRLAALGMPAAFARERLLLQIVPLVLGIGLVAALSRERRASAGLAALLALFAASRVLEQSGTHPTMPETTFYPRFAVLDAIPPGGAYRMAGVGRALIPNASAVYGLDDVRGYEAMTLRRFRDTFPLWCEEQPVWFNRIDDPARPFVSFLAARWVLTERPVPAPAGWPTRAEGAGLRLLENPKALALAFAPRLYRSEPDPALRLAALEAIGDFGEQGVVEDGPAGDWVENGQARVAVVRASAGRMEVDVDALGPVLVATSLTAWPGWRAELDGSPVAALPYNHAFLAFRAPPGRHRLTLDYSPDGFRYGAGVSLATLVAGAAILWRSSRRKVGENPM